MEEEAQAAAADTAARPAPPVVDAVADAPVAESFEARPDLELASDWSNIDQMIEEARAAAEAPAATEEDLKVNGELAPDAGNEVPPPGQSITAAATDIAPDPTKTVEELRALGYTVEAPAPPPDPFETLRADLAPYVGNERYEQLKAVAFQPIPAEPPAYDAESVAAHEKLVSERNAAAAELRQMDVNRQIHGKSYAWARQQVLGELSNELSGLPQKYAGVDPARVLTPRSMADAVDAVAEAVTARLNAEWQAKYDQREKFWAGKVKQAEADSSLSRHRAIAGAPAATSVPGGRVAPSSPLSGLFGEKGLPSDDVIERAKRGELASLDLSRE